MKNHLSLTALLMVLHFTVQAEVNTMPADTTKKNEIKSYFLLRLNLETDPADLQNYLAAQQFKDKFQAFARSYAANFSQLDPPIAQLLKWAVADAMNGDLDHATQNFKEAISIKSINEDKRLLMAIYDCMSSITELKGEYEQSFAYQQQALSLALAENRQAEIARFYMQLGRIKSLQKQYAIADDYLLKKALPAFTRIKDQKDIAICYREIADRYVLQERFSEANWFYLQSLTLSRKVFYPSGIIAALLELGQFKFDTGSVDPAISDWQEAERLAITNHDLPVLLKLKFNLALAFKECGKIAPAEKYAMEFEQLKDILLNPVL